MVRNNNEARFEPKFAEFLDLLRPAWERLMKRLAHISARLDDLESTRSDIQDLEERLDRLDADR